MVLIISCLLVAGCGYHDPTQVLVQERRPPPAVIQKIHTVQKGETLYSIAWLYNRDVDDLAYNNQITAPYTIYPNQQIHLVAHSQRLTPQPVAASNNTTRQTDTVAAPAIRSTAETEANTLALRWQWPAKGHIMADYSESGKLNKGIDIRGKLGEPVAAAAHGKVVHAGSELRGYGQLIILKHDNGYLSAYAHNKTLHVRLGDAVKAGQKIAEIGSTGTTEPKLHFEIRRNGKPVDPMRYLPKR